MRTAAWRLAPIALSATCGATLWAACGGTSGPPNPLVLGLLDASASSAAEDGSASSALDATTGSASSAGFDAATGSASSAGLDATTGSACTGGTWALSETSGACGGCPNIADQVAIVVSDQTAAEGGTLSDSEGNTWTFDPSTCTAKLTGDCDASDTLFFTTGTATCMWTCGSFCPPCPASCILMPYP